MTTDYTTLTAEQKYELLTNDFLERDGDTFVRIRTSDRIGWEDTLPKDSAYSSIILNPKSVRELFNNAMTLARQMIVSMNTPFKVNVVLHPDSSFTTGKNVFIATKVFDDKELSLGKKLDTFLGLTVHEGSHLLYTDFNKLTENKNKVIHDLWNIIEDERIERRLGEEKPGLANFLKATKYYYFGKFSDEIESERQDDKFIRLYNTILSFIRYPASLRPADLTEFADQLLQIKDILTPYPDSTAEALEKAKEIYEIVKEFINEQMQQPSSGGENPQQNQGQGQPQGNSGNGSGGQQDNPDDTTAGTPQNQPLTDEQIEQILSKITEASEILTKPLNGDDKKNTLNTNDVARDLLKNDGLIAKECQGELEIGETYNWIILKAKSDKNLYLDSLSRVRKYIPAVANALRANETSYEYNITSMRNGILDTNKLSEARQGVQNVYMIKGKVKSEKINIAILIDESGSMYGSREKMARDAAVLLNEATAKLHNVNLFIYGYTNNQNNNTLINYKEGRNGDRYALGSVSNYSGTPTAEAMMEASLRIRKRTDEKTIMFILSDGEAAGGPQTVRTSTDILKKKNIEVIGLSISQSLSKQKLEMMYDHYLTMYSLDSLAIDFGKVVKKAILQASKRTTTRQ